MTEHQARELLRPIGMVIRRDEHEYRVNFRGGTEETAYYTPSLRDAVETARLMARRRDETTAIHMS